VRNEGLHTSGKEEIGGSCVEIESGGARIVLDVGLPLDVPNPEKVPLPPICGFETFDPSLLGVVISHPHQDHFGLAYKLPDQTLFLIGKAAQSISRVVHPGGGANIRERATPGRSKSNSSRSLHHYAVSCGPFGLRRLRHSG